MCTNYLLFITSLLLLSVRPIVHWLHAKRIGRRPLTSPNKQPSRERQTCSRGQRAARPTCVRSPLPAGGASPPRPRIELLLPERSRSRPCTACGASLLQATAATAASRRRGRSPAVYVAYRSRSLLRSSVDLAIESPAVRQVKVRIATSSACWHPLQGNRAVRPQLGSPHAGAAQPQRRRPRARQPLAG